MHVIFTSSISCRSRWDISRNKKKKTKKKKQPLTEFTSKVVETIHNITFYLIKARLLKNNNNFDY